MGAAAAAKRRVKRERPPKVDVPSSYVRFNGKEAYQAYCDWVKYGTSPHMQRAVMYALPVVAFTSARMEVPPGRKSEIVSEGQFAVFEIVNRRQFKIPVDWESPAGAYCVFLRKRIWSAMRSLADKMNGSRGEYLYGQPELPYGEYTKRSRFKETELKLFIEKLPVALLEAVSKKIRFTGTDRDAVLWIANRLVSNRLISIKLLKTKFGIKDPDFLIAYATVMLRRAVYDFRAEHDGVVVGDWTDLTSVIDPESCVEDHELMMVDEEAYW